MAPPLATRIRRLWLLQQTVPSDTSLMVPRGDGTSDNLTCMEDGTNAVCYGPGANATGQYTTAIAQKQRQQQLPKTLILEQQLLVTAPTQAALHGNWPTGQC